MKHFGKKLLAGVLSFTMFASIFSYGGTVYAAENSSTEQTAAAQQEYEIYPIPQQMQYVDSSWTLGTEANVVYESGIDSATKARLSETLALKNIQSVESEQIVNGKTNILVGIYGSEEFADQYVTENDTIHTVGLYEKNDAYLLTSSENTVVVLGKDTDAAFYGLTSLYHILAQMETNEIRSFHMEDWADVVSRGFIEGYYGNPWSLEDRCELMKWAGYYKMNVYFYAPKDDPKHNRNWRELYTDDELNTLIKPLAEAGNASKCRFVYALHPYMYQALGTGTGGYDADLKVMQAKFEQVIKAGVRQIAILADDAADRGSEAYIQMLTDMSAWLKEMQKTYPDLKLVLPFCTVEYMYNGQSYYADFPENVQIVMTGGRVWGEVSNDFTTTFTNNTGRGVFMWVNWPCTDNSKNHLIMGGYTTFLHPGTEPEKIQGIMLNPMQQSEPSKVAIFGNAVYSWHIWETAEIANQAWEDSFKYVDHNSAVKTETSDALKELSKHMINQAMDSRVTALEESVEIADTLTAFKADLTAGTVTAAKCDEIIGIFEVLEDAAEIYKNNGNDRIKEQIIYWLDNWTDTTEAAIAYLEAVKAELSGDDNTLLQKYNVAKTAFAASKSHGFDYMGETKYAESGVQHIVPFINVLETYVESRAELIMDPEAILATYITSRTDSPAEGSEDSIFDGDEDTCAIYKTPNAIYEGDYVGVLYNRVIDIKDAKFVLGAGKDHFDEGKVQYTLDGNDWIDLGITSTGVIGQKQIVTLNEENLSEDFQAMGIRFTATRNNANDAWLNVCEISVNESQKEETEASIYENVIKTSRWTVYQGSESNLYDGDDSTFVWYNPQGGDGNSAEIGDYLGYDFGKVLTLKSIHAVVGNSEADKFVKYTVDVSIDGNTWETLRTVEGNESGTDQIDIDLDGKQARYVRICNQELRTKWVKFSEFTVEYVKDASDKYVYTNLTSKDLLTLEEPAQISLVAAEVALKKNEYVGIKLSNIKEIEKIDVTELKGGLKLQTSLNGIEWIDYTKEETDARYIRVINTSDETVTWTFDTFSVSYYEVGEVTVTSTFAKSSDERDVRSLGNVANIFDGNMSTYAEITGSQDHGKEIVFDLGRNIDFRSIRYYITESNKDYLRYAKFEVSADQEDWTEVLVVGNAGVENTSNDTTAKEANYLTHDNSNPGYMYAESTELNAEGRYLRIVPLETYSHRWVQINEIVINGGEYLSSEDNRDIISDKSEKEYQIPSNAFDGKLSTSYIPGETNGYFTYRLSEPENVRTVRMIQLGVESNAVVTAEFTDGTLETVGRLKQCINDFQVPEGKILRSVTVRWEDKIPEIAEIKTFTAAVELPELPEKDDVHRLYGKSRYETSRAIADELKAQTGVTQFKTVLVATGGDKKNGFADALSGSYLAALKNAPILLTSAKNDKNDSSKSIDQNLINYIKTNLTSGGKIYILGGSAAVPNEMETALKNAGFDVVRLSGASRYETNLAILEEAANDEEFSADELIVATGLNFADSLSASAVKKPILLVNGGNIAKKDDGSLTDAQKKFVAQKYKDAKTYIVGGTGAVSKEVQSQLEKILTKNTIRIFGASRYDTSVAIAKCFFGENIEHVIVASGVTFPDGLCGGALAAALNVPLVLTKDGDTSAASYVEDCAVQSGYVLGGTGAVKDETVVNIFQLESADDIK